MRWAALWVVLQACDGDGGGGPGEDRARSEEPATVVEVVPAATGAVADVILTTATVTSEHEADVVPLAGGTVVSVLAEEGDTVRKGAVLAVLDNASLDGAAERAGAELDRLEAQLRTVRELHGQGAASDKELADAEFALRQASAQAKEAARTQGQTRLVAPFDGVVALRAVRQGQYAPPGAPAFTVVDPAKLRVVVALPERDLPRVKDGQGASVASAYDASVSARATVLRTAPVVDAATGTFRATLALDDRSPLRPGQFVTVALEVDRHDGVLTVPREALVYEDGEAIVYTMVDAPPEKPEADTDADEPDNAIAKFFAQFSASAAEGDTDEDEAGPAFVAKRVPVKVGLQDPHAIEVLDGLAAGDGVIVVGQSNLRDGAAVQTPEMQAAAKAKKAAEKKPGDEG